jgi:hypothetical protein
MRRAGLSRNSLAFVQAGFVDSEARRAAASVEREQGEGSLSSRHWREALAVATRAA